MPYFREGSPVYLVEEFIEKPDSFSNVLPGLASGCSCAIIDSPFAATLEYNGFLVDRVVGVGSIVCDPRCGSSGQRWRLATPAWGQGRVLRQGLECLVYGNEVIRAQLASIGLRPRGASLHEVVDAATREGLRGVVFLDEEADPLAVEPRPGTCGTLSTTNPLHPSGAFGKPRLHACVENLYRLVGPLARLTTPILSIGRGKETLISRIEGLGSAIIVHTDVEAASSYVRLASWLGALYECGSSTEYM